jgi:hypothetical protein
MCLGKPQRLLSCSTSMGRNSEWSELAGAPVFTLQLLISYGRLDVLQWILSLDGVEIDAQDYGGATALHLAEYEPHSQTIEVKQVRACLVSTYGTTFARPCR